MNRMFGNIITRLVSRMLMKLWVKNTPDEFGGSPQDKKRTGKRIRQAMRMLRRFR